MTLVMKRIELYVQARDVIETETWRPILRQKTQDRDLK